MFSVFLLENLNFGKGKKKTMHRRKWKRSLGDVAVGRGVSEKDFNAKTQSCRGYRLSFD